MSLDISVIDKFGSLDLYHDPQTINPGRAIDAVNVDMSEPSRIVTRDGYVKYNTTTPPVTGYNVMVETIAGGTRHLIGVRNVLLDKIAVGGAVTAGIAAPPANFFGFSTADFGTAAGTILYLADARNAGPGTLLQKWNGAVIANSVGQPRYVAPFRNGTRLIQGNYSGAATTPSGANGSPSTVFISDALAPDTYTATNFEKLRENDGEEIIGIVTWHDSTFVFKPSSIFVFYGETPDDDGLPIFNFRRVEPPTRVITSSSTPFPQHCAYAGPDGVYYHAIDGIYKMDGAGVPKMVSQDVRGIFEGTASTSQSRTRNSGASYLTWVDEKMFLSYVTVNLSRRVLVYDKSADTWAFWSMPDVSTLASAPAIFGISSFSNNGSRAPIFAKPDVADVFAFAPGTVGDNGANTSWRYQSGYYDLGVSGEKRLRYTDIYGSGSVTSQILQLGYRSTGIADPGSTVVLGVSPTVTRQRRSIGLRGRAFSHVLSGATNTQRGVVTRLEHRFTKDSPV